MLSASSSHNSACQSGWPWKARLPRSHCPAQAGDPWPQVRVLPGAPPTALLREGFLLVGGRFAGMEKHRRPPSATEGRPGAVRLSPGPGGRRGHPRACGEHGARSLGSSVVSGPSPRVRGAVSVVWGFIRLRGRSERLSEVGRHLCPATQGSATVQRTRQSLRPLTTAEPGPETGGGRTEGTRSSWPSRVRQCDEQVGPASAGARCSSAALGAEVSASGCGRSGDPPRHYGVR